MMACQETEINLELLFGATLAMPEEVEKKFINR